MGAVQTFDEGLAQKYGVPVSVVKGARKALGIPDARIAPPAANRVLPPEWVYTYDLLDQDGKIVNTSLFHYSTTPRIVPASEKVIGPIAPTTVSAPASQAQLEAVLQAVSGNTNSTKDLLP